MNGNKITNPEDMRVRRTRKLLSNALLDLMQQKSFGSLTVTDICEEAMVHRTTFYSHFVDKYDLLQYAVAEKQREFEEQSRLEGEYGDTSEFYVALFRRVVNYLRDNRKLFASATSRNNGMEVQIARRILSDSIKRFIQRRNQGERHGAMPADVEAQCVAGAMMSLAAWWIEEDSPIPEEDLCKYIGEILRARVSE